MRTMFLAVATIALAVPAPAAAQATQQPAAAKSQGAKQLKYCIKDESTGSRVSGQTCKTKSDWAREGIDIDKLLKS